MIYLRNINTVPITVIIGLIPFSFVFVDADLGASCKKVFNIALFCSGRNIHCAADNTCQCRSTHPVIINRHLCLKQQLYNEKCEDSLQCTHYDLNTYCTLGSIQSICNCKSDFEFNEINKKCQKLTKVGKSSSVSVPGAIIITVAIVGSICALLLLAHYFFRRKSHIRLMAIISSCHSDIPMSEPSNQPSAPAHSDNTTNLLSSNLNATDPLPSYDTAISLEHVDNPELSRDIECPPSYDEVMKHSVIELNETKNIST